MSSDEPEPLSDEAFDAMADEVDLTGDYAADVAYWRQEYERLAGSSAFHEEEDLSWYIARCGELEEAAAAAEEPPFDEPGEEIAWWVPEVIEIFRNCGYDLPVDYDTARQVWRLRAIIDAYRVSWELPSFDDAEFVLYVRETCRQITTTGIQVTRIHPDGTPFRALESITAQLDDMEETLANGQAALNSMPLPNSPSEQDILSHVEAMMRTLPYQVTRGPISQHDVAEEPAYTMPPASELEIVDEMHNVDPETLRRVMEEFTPPPGATSVFDTPRSPRRSAFLAWYDRYTTSSDHYMTSLRVGDVVWLPREMWFARVAGVWRTQNSSGPVTATTVGKIDLVLPDLTTNTWWVRTNGAGLDDHPLVQPWTAQGLISIAESQPSAAPAKSNERVRAIEL